MIFYVDENLIRKLLPKGKKMTDAEKMLDLFSASVSDGLRKYKGEDIPEGYLITTWAELGERWGCHRDTAKVFCKGLQEDGVISINPIPKGNKMIIKILHVERS